MHRLANSPTFVGSCLDFTNPETVAWWQSHIRRLAQMGVDGFKTDFGEQVPEDAVFADGRTGRELHNVYPRLYNQATAEALAQETAPDQSGGILLARSAWHGSQRFSAIFAGDQSSDFGPATGLPSVIVAGQNAGLSGFPYWACDIGGYFGTPTDEVFVRWAQFGAFCPIMQIHGTGCREPWRFSATTLATYRRYAQLRMDLLPYIYTLAQQAAETGLPMMRALPLEFPDDPGVWDDVAEREYCFGEQLLVAPVYYGLDRFRYLYLPAGGWRDFWTGEWREGGRVHQVPADLETIPVHARAGAIIPWLDPSADTCVPAEDPATRSGQAGADLRLSLYPGADGSFQLYDGTRFIWREQEAVLLVRRQSGRATGIGEHRGTPGRRAPGRSDRMASRSSGRRWIWPAGPLTHASQSAAREHTGFTGTGWTEVVSLRDCLRRLNSSHAEAQRTQRGHRSRCPRVSLRLCVFA